MVTSIASRSAARASAGRFGWASTFIQLLTLLPLAGAVQIGKEILPELLAAGGSAKALVEKKGLLQISDSGELEKIIDAVLAANDKQVQEFRGGKEKVKGFFVGQIMKQSGGRANPALLEQLLMPKLRGEAKK